MTTAVSIKNRANFQNEDVELSCYYDHEGGLTGTKIGDDVTLAPNEEMQPAAPHRRDFWIHVRHVTNPDAPNESMMVDVHPATGQVLRFFDYRHLPPHLQEVSRPLHDIAMEMAYRLEGPELTAGLRKLLEAKDCFVRAAV